MSWCHVENEKGGGATEGGKLKSLEEIERLWMRPGRKDTIYDMLSSEKPAAYVCEVTMRIKPWIEHHVAPIKEEHRALARHAIQSAIAEFMRRCEKRRQFCIEIKISELLTILELRTIADEMLGDVEGGKGEE